MYYIEINMGKFKMYIEEILVNDDPVWGTIGHPRTKKPLLFKSYEEAVETAKKTGGYVVETMEELRN